MRTIRRMVPRSMRRGLKGRLNAARSRVEMLELKRDYHSRYGRDFVYTVDDRDEMFQFISEFWSWPHHVIRMKAPSDAMLGYLASGDAMMRDLEQVLRDQRRDLGQLDSFLEFACGYGRFTRFLVTRLDPARITVSDINRSAVDFVRETFAVSGFYSTECASELDHARQYEVIFVASLFSHLAFEHWTPWLQRLYALLAPGGLLIFSTHGPYARDEIYGERARSQLEPKAEGFSFLRTNETSGRLAVDYYGSAFVERAFVEEQVAAHGLGAIRHVYPARLWGTQDVYVLAKPAPNE
jgi:SAM-dependent methyltransferase